MKIAEADHQTARELAERWEHAGSELDARRLSDLRALSERGAAERFATLLRLEGAYPLRPSSGLVEQQRVFDRLRQ